MSTVEGYGRDEPLLGWKNNMWGPRQEDVEGREESGYEEKQLVSQSQLEWIVLGRAG